uniref:Uncharacterized protein n=1 Tax=Leptobrachium leishanense TaxID=445787 RepID=A0A8C5M3Q7_9ANUR
MIPQLRLKDTGNYLFLLSFWKCIDFLISFHQIPLGLRPNIRSLHLAKNELENITESPLFLYSFIDFLDLSTNKISFIQHNSFKDMVNLKEINISDNYLDRFAQQSEQGIGILPYVQKLDLSRNSLYNDMTRLFLQEAPHLQYLTLAGNSITTLSPETFHGSPMLRELDLHNNIIMDIEEGTFEHLKHLTEINLATNSISCISDFKVRQLQSLNLSKNSIQMFLTSESDEEYMLEQVDLSDNKLSTFPVFPKINNLISLNLSMNVISLSGETTFDELSWMDDSFLLRSETEDTVRNVTPVFLPKLTYLDLSYNNIESIPEDFFVTMPFIRVLKLYKNCLKSVSLGRLTPLNLLEILDLSGNNLENISIAENSLGGLRELYLQDNQLHMAEPRIFHRLPNINLINLQNNNIMLSHVNSRRSKRKSEEYYTGISFFNIPTLQHLNLRENRIRHVPQASFNGTPLTYLDLSMNFGLTVAPNALAGLERFLEVLYMEGNGMEQLNHCKLEKLDLSNNSFIDLKDSNIPVLVNTLKTLSLYGNPLGCCANSWVIHLMKRTTLTIVSLDSTTCSKSNSFTEELLIGQMMSENCESEDLNKMNVIVIVLIVIAVVSVVAAGLGTVCHFCRQKSKQQYKA